MKLKKDGSLKKSKGPAGSLVLYIASIVVALMGLAYLVTNIVLFQKAVAQYVAQGYPAVTVTSQLIPSQLLPGIYEPIGVYGGIALLLFGVGMLNQKLWNYLRLRDISTENAQLKADETNETDIAVSETNTLEPDDLKSDEFESNNPESREEEQ
ncbi:hypothetical protein [Desulfosporosinus sp. SB140]|uniref:hypothetical protein n=1 Tax=Desulfosporosinus paludis TaxID=3115649 RepID=UPI00388F13AD